MSSVELFALFLLLAAGWLWLDSIKVREIGIAAVRRACATDDLQFLDESVTIASLRPARDEDGRARWRRVYWFEFSDTGNNRRRGSVILLGHRVVVINTGLRLVP